MGEKQKIEVETADLVIVDTWRALSRGKRIAGLPKDKRDKYIKKVQKDIKAALECAKKKPKCGNLLIGVDVFSMSSLGEDALDKKNTKRALVWLKEQDETTKPIMNKYREMKEWFIWGVRDRGWAFNLLGNEKYFDGEFRTAESDTEDALKVAKEMVLRFTDEGGTVLVVNDFEGSVMKEAIESTGRVYVSGVRDKETGGLIHA
ncbi:hypothetical protein ACTFR8_22035 [Bacillus cereus group sp. MYBK15-3]|uniref:hypothetical protein n=1 Tax=unclassified Bacillus cereus group TaxID=2750818 RepID=UPI003F79717C